MTSRRANVQLAFLFLVGLGAGIWTVIAPWVQSYPTPSGAWTSSIWSATWVGGIVAVASGLGLVIVLGLAAADALKSQRALPPEAR